jgi:hypothetical protein
MICLGVAVWRAGVLPRWVSVAFVICPLLGVAGLPGGAALIGDYLLFVTLATVAVIALRLQSDVGDYSRRAGIEKRGRDAYA